MSKLNIDDFTKCYICLGKLVDATMCPHCSKLSCHKCIQKWLLEKKSQCPYCRMALKYTQIVPCRFINELSSIIENVNVQNPVISKEHCLEHKISNLYYCLKCQEPLCSDCFMVEKKHQDHEIKHLDQIYKSHLNSIKGESSELQKKLDELNNKLFLIEEKISILKSAKNERSQELDLIYENLKKKIESIMREKLLNLMKKKTTISSKIEDFTKLSDEMKKKIHEFSKSEFIEKSNHLIKSIKELSIDEEIFKENFDFSVEYNAEITPPYESSSFEIVNYKSLVNSNDIIYSPSFQTNNFVWRLKIYPYGNGPAKNEFISIFLELTEGSIESSKFYYKIELVNFSKDKNSYEKEYKSDFKNGECWGYNRFYRIDSLEKDGFIEPNTGKILINYYIRPLTYLQLFKENDNYIKTLEKKLNMEKIYDTKKGKAQGEGHKYKENQVIQENNLIISTKSEKRLSNESSLKFKDIGDSNVREKDDNLNERGSTTNTNLNLPQSKKSKKHLDIGYRFKDYTDNLNLNFNELEFTNVISKFDPLNNVNDINQGGFFHNNKIVGGFNKGSKLSEIDRYEFLNLLDNNNELSLDSQLKEDLIQKNEASDQESSIDLTDFERNFLESEHERNYDDFSQRLKLKFNYMNRKENNTESKINEMMSSLFPEENKKLGIKQYSGKNLPEIETTVQDKNKFFSLYDKLIGKKAASKKTDSYKFLHN